MYEERTFATLHHSETAVDLCDHRLEMVSVYLGHTSLILSPNSPQAGNIMFALRQQQELTSIVPDTLMVLEPGTCVQIGKINGVEIVGEDIPIDPTFVEAIKRDRHISRQHAQIYINSGTEVVVRDLNSTNGTFVKDLVEAHQSRRGHLRLVE